jgi:glycosyltransferase involved in cell wall biosynthesis
MWTSGGKRGWIGWRAAGFVLFFVQTAVRALLLPPQDVIVALTTPPFVALAAWLHKAVHPAAKLVLWNMDTYPDVLEMTGHVRPGGIASRALQSANRFLFRRLDHVIALDTAMARRLSVRYASSQGPDFTVIPNWERADVFPDLPPLWQGPPLDRLAGRFVVLYLGNAGNAHDFRAVIAAADALRDEPISFLFVGGGDKWRELERARRELDLPNVHLHGYVPKEATPSLMRGCHAALITLRDEAAGLVSPSKLHAYLAAGLPVVYVGPPESNVADAIGDREVGFAVAAEDVRALVLAFRQLREDPGLAEAFKANARRAFLDLYSDARTLPCFKKLLDAIAGGREPDGPGTFARPTQAVCE